eukprot:jgi/Chlat1/4011/Chrsp26S04074
MARAGWGLLVGVLLVAAAGQLPVRVSATIPADCGVTFDNLWLSFAKWIGETDVRKQEEFKQSTLAMGACANFIDLEQVCRKVEDTLHLMLYEDSGRMERHKEGNTLLAGELQRRELEGGNPTRCDCDNGIARLVASAATSQVDAGSQPKPNPLAVVVYAPHKTGSSFVNRLLRGVSTLCRVCHFSDSYSGSVCVNSDCAITDKLHAKDYTSSRWGSCYEWNKDHIEAANSQLETAGTQARSTIEQRVIDGFIWGPVRNFSEQADVSAYSERLYIFQQRHPLDMLVSEFHALAQSGDLTEKQTVDEFVLQVLPYLRDSYTPMFDMLKKLPPSEVHISRYEDLFLDFDSWLDAMVLLFHSLCAGIEETASEYLQKELAPALTQTEPNSVFLPGEHKKELKKETIDEAYRREPELFARLNYPQDV